MFKKNHEPPVGSTRKAVTPPSINFQLFHDPLLLPPPPLLEINNGRSLIKKGYGCKWTRETIKFYMYTQINVNEQHLYCCSTFYSYSRVFNNEINSYIKMSVWWHLAFTVCTYNIQSYQVTCDSWVVSHGTLVSSINKTDRRDITKILLKVALNAINHNHI